MVQSRRTRRPVRPSRLRRASARSTGSPSFSRTSKPDSALRRRSSLGECVDAGRDRTCAHGWRARCARWTNAGRALVDAARSALLVATLAVAAISISALALALWPIFPVVMGARIARRRKLGPVIAALSLAVAGHAWFGERPGRNARFASLGAGITAAAMGACRQFLSARSVFVLTAALALPVIFVLAHHTGTTPPKATSRPDEGVARPGEEGNESAGAGAAGCAESSHTNRGPL